MDSLDAQARAEVEQYVQNEAAKAKIHQAVHELTSLCWDKCVTSPIKSGQLESSEGKCVKDCVGRWMDVTIQVAKNLGAVAGK